MHHDYMDKFAHGQSPIHALDARVKLLMVVLYTVALISVERHQVAALAPLAVGPVAMMLLGRIPLRFALKRVVLLSPFVLTLCLFQPVYLRQPMPVQFGPWQFALAEGWLVAADMAGKFALGLLALTALMCTTSFASLLGALRNLRVPRMLVMMLGFLYRYLFVLLDEAMRIRRGRDFRGANLAPVSRRLLAVGAIVGGLFLRTFERGERIHLAMSTRGFDGVPRTLEHPHLHRADGVFLACSFLYIVGAWLYAWCLTRSA